MGMVPNGRTQSTTKERTRRAIEMRIQGKTYREISTLLQCTRQYVQYLLSPPPWIAQDVRERQRGLCYDCRQLTEHGHIHHVRTQCSTAQAYADKVNMVYLCKSCHAERHTKDRPTRICSQCQKVFTLRIPSSKVRFCSLTCSARENKAKLTESTVKEIRRILASSSLTQAEIAKQFGVSQQGISRILNKLTWKITA